MFHIISFVVTIFSTYISELYHRLDEALQAILLEHADLLQREVLSQELEYVLVRIVRIVYEEMPQLEYLVRDPDKASLGTLRLELGTELVVHWLAEELLRLCLREVID